ncbi:MAG: hypothetical protein HRU19_21910 [Pseudobacteriovorax sp.]|nr:hypothetical protein [Pseudobacteriovorax sp.]
MNRSYCLTGVDGTGKTALGDYLVNLGSFSCVFNAPKYNIEPNDRDLYLLSVCSKINEYADTSRNYTMKAIGLFLSLSVYQRRLTRLKRQVKKGESFGILQERHPVIDTIAYVRGTYGKQLSCDDLSALTKVLSSEEAFWLNKQIAGLFGTQKAKGRELIAFLKSIGSSTIQQSYKDLSSIYQYTEKPLVFLTVANAETVKQRFASRQRLEVHECEHELMKVQGIKIAVLESLNIPYKSIDTSSRNVETTGAQINELIKKYEVCYA